MLLPSSSLTLDPPSCWKRSYNSILDCVIISSRLNYCNSVLAGLQAFHIKFHSSRCKVFKMSLCIFLNSICGITWLQVYFRFSCTGCQPLARRSSSTTEALCANHRCKSATLIFSIAERWPYSSSANRSELRSACRVDVTRHTTAETGPVTCLPSELHKIVDSVAFMKELLKRNF